MYPIPSLTMKTVTWANTGLPSSRVSQEQLMLALEEKERGPQGAQLPERAVSHTPKEGPVGQTRETPLLHLCRQFQPFLRRWSWESSSIPSITAPKASTS